MKTFVACADDEEEKMTVTIEALDADDNVLATKVVENVPFKATVRLSSPALSSQQTPLVPPSSSKPPG